MRWTHHCLFFFPFKYSQTIKANVSLSSGSIANKQLRITFCARVVFSRTSFMKYGRYNGRILCVSVASALSEQGGKKFEFQTRKRLSLEIYFLIPLAEHCFKPRFFLHRNNSYTPPALLLDFFQDINRLILTDFWVSRLFATDVDPAQGVYTSWICAMLPISRWCMFLPSLGS
jgi:hypothetical protein